MSVELSELEQLRRKSLTALRELGIEPYPAEMYDVTATTPVLHPGSPCGWNGVELFLHFTVWRGRGWL